MTWLARKGLGLSGASDPYWSSVVLLVGNNNGTAGFIDQSQYGHTVTANGNWQWTETAPPAGMLSCMLSDGSGDFLSITPLVGEYSTVLGLSNLDFCIEGVLEVVTLTNAYPTFYAHDLAGLFLRNNVDANSYFQWGVSPAYRAVSTPSQLALAPVHYAFIRQGDVGRLMIGGEPVGAAANLAGVVFPAVDTTAFLGAFNASGLYSVSAKWGPQRWTVGNSRYSLDGFTPPPLPFPVG